MTDRLQFRRCLQETLADIDPEILAYDETEFPLVRSLYEKIAFYAERRELLNTAVALRLSRGLHNGVHRKNMVLHHGETVKLPYVIHPIVVCRMLVDVEPDLPAEELDVLLAAALCHDMVEDIPFPDHGRELYTKFHMDPRVYETVKKVSKRKDFTKEEEQAHFRGIQEDPLALLVKLSDRGNNVEDLYNMRLAKVHEYAEETRKYFYPMCEYGKKAYPALAHTITLLEEKIATLVDAAETLTDRYNVRITQLQARRDALQAENDSLRRQMSELMMDERWYTRGRQL